MRDLALRAHGGAAGGPGCQDRHYINPRVGPRALLHPDHNELYSLGLKPLLDDTLVEQVLKRIISTKTASSSTRYRASTGSAAAPKDYVEIVKVRGTTGKCQRGQGIKPGALVLVMGDWPLVPGYW